MPYDIIIGRDETDKKRFGDKGLVYLGRGYVKMGQYTSLSNKIFMDIARSHVVLVSGKRGTGKSYTLGVIAEELATMPDEVKENIASIIFDTMGIFWTMKYPNDKEKELLAEQGLKPKKTPSQVFVPSGFYDEYTEKGLPADSTFSLDPSELNIEDWLQTFKLDFIDPIAVVIERTIGKLKERKDERGESFDIDDIINEMRHDKEVEENVKNAAIGIFEAAKGWKLFSSRGEKATETSDIVKAGFTSVLDLSMYSSVSTFNVRALVISLVLRKVFTERMRERKGEEVQAVEHGLDYLTFKVKREMPMVWFFIDEVHEFLPEEGKTPATDALIQVLREGRQPGLSLVMATQQPGALRRDAITQSDIVLSHRVTAQPDVNALNYIMQSYLAGSIKRYMDELPPLKGSGIILDDNSERIYPMRVRPRFTWHGGESPTAIKIEKRI